MKIINLDYIKTHKFYLWKDLYKYQFKHEDKEYYSLSLLSLNPKNDNSDKLLEIFTNILEKQNLTVKLLRNDIKWLFNFFNYTLL
jgi:hypothetical protein